MLGSVFAKTLRDFRGQVLGWGQQFHRYPHRQSGEEDYRRDTGEKVLQA